MNIHKPHFSHTKSTRRFRLKPAHVLIFVLLVLAVIQVERFIRAGTILGYQVRDVRSSSQSQKQNQSGALLGGEAGKANVDSRACKDYSAEEVSKIVSKEVQRISGFIPDVDGPPSISTCIYRTQGAISDSTTVSILVREQADESTARKVLDAQAADNDVSEINDLADRAIFNKSANQLSILNGRKAVTITVSSNSLDTTKAKDIAIAVARLSL